MASTSRSTTVLAVMLFNGLLNRLERHVLRWRLRERAAQTREFQ